MGNRHRLRHSFPHTYFLLLILAAFERSRYIKIVLQLPLLLPPLLLYLFIPILLVHAPNEQQMSSHA